MGEREIEGESEEEVGEGGRKEVEGLVEGAWKGEVGEEGRKEIDAGHEEASTTLLYSLFTSCVVGTEIKGEKGRGEMVDVLLKQVSKDDMFECRRIDKHSVEVVAKVKVSKGGREVAEEGVEGEAEGEVGDAVGEVVFVQGGVEEVGEGDGGS